MNIPRMRIKQFRFDQVPSNPRVMVAVNSQPFDLRRARVHREAKGPLRLVGEACNVRPKFDHQLDQAPVCPPTLRRLEEKDADLVGLAEGGLGTRAMDVHVLRQRNAVHLGDGRNPRFIRRTLPEFLDDGEHGHVVPAPPLLECLHPGDEMRGKVLVEVDPHAAARSSKFHAASI